MQQHAAPLDMAKEAVPDADAVGSPFDQAGDVGDHELAALVAHHAKLGFQRGEGIVAHLRLGIGGGIEERSEEHTSELQSLMRISYAVFCFKHKKFKAVT